MWQAVKDAEPGGATKATLEVTLGKHLANVRIKISIFVFHNPLLSSLNFILCYHWIKVGIGAAMKRRWLMKGKEGKLIQGEGEGKGNDFTRGLLKALAEGGDIPHVCSRRVFCMEFEL